MKKVLSLLLSIVMLVSVTAGMTITSSASSIQTIKFGEEVSGECDHDEHAYYQFNVPISGAVTFDVKGTTYTWRGKDDIVIQIYKSPYNMGNLNYDYEIHADYSDAFDCGIAKETINLKAGTYYIRTDYWCGSGNAYDYYDYYDYNILLTYKPNISTPSTLKVSTRNTTSLKLSWSKVSGASGYQLQRKSGDSYKTLTNTTARSYTVKKLKAGTTYKFRVRTYKTISGKKYYSSWKTLTTPTKPSKPSIKTPGTNKKHQIIAKWKAVSKCTGYQVQYSKKKNFSSVIATKTVSGRTKTSYTGKNFTKGKTYYVRVRSYKTVNGKKYYSAWSSVKSIKCK